MRLHEIQRRPTFEPDNGMYRYSDGDVVATIDIGSDYAAIYEFSSRESGEGHARAALQYLKEKFGYIAVTDIGSQGDPSYSFWMHALDKGLVNEVHDDEGDVYKR